MKEIFLDGNFDVEDTTLKINNLMSKWSIHMLEIKINTAASGWFLKLIFVISKLESKWKI